VGGNDIWRTRIRLMLLIPAVILPMAIVVIALSKSTVIGKLSMHQGHGDEGVASPELLDQQTEYYSRENSCLFTRPSPLLYPLIHKALIL
jgi:hypothetical protein